MLYAQFKELQAIHCINHLLTRRISDIDVQGERDVVLERLAETHRRCLEKAGMPAAKLVRANQVHGHNSVIVAEPQILPVPHTDGLITRTRGLPLGIYVADCCPVYIVDPVQPAIALVHAGRKGMEQEIVGKTVDTMKTAFGSNPADMSVFLGPCIHGDHYEVDIPQKLIAQCHALGITKVTDSGKCTACLPSDYYSYRMEKGKTGRMLAVLMLN
ncbi:MAG: polyphenol oxidase family protein [Verrucomicrobiota bacterium]|nr:polyphenol oxidase family protein [Verrucomicrobiota bacterium]